VDLTSTGYVVPQLVAKVGANVGGRLVTVNVREGGKVDKDETLFEIDHSTLDAQISAAKARVSSAYARVLTAKASVSEAKLPLERERKLAAAGAATQAVVDDLTARVATLDQQVRATEAEVGAAQAEVDALSAQVPQYTVKAPFSGVAQTKPAQLGDVVAPSQPLVELVDPTELVIEADVPEGRLGLVAVGRVCEVVLESKPEARLKAHVVGMGPRINRSKSTGIVKVKLDDASVALSPDMSARVSFFGKDAELPPSDAKPKTVVPRAAVVDRSGKKAVFVVRDGKIELVPVTVGEEIESGFELVDGPPPGTRVVKNPAETLRDGQSVKEGSS
jgi:HlyD family secretion protein